MSETNNLVSEIMRMRNNVTTLPNVAHGHNVRELQ